MQLQLQRALQGDVAFAAGVIADGVGQGAGQDLAQPDGALGPRPAAEIRLRLMRLQQGDLHQVGRVKLALKLSRHLQPGQEAQLLAEALQPQAGFVVGSAHRPS